MRLALVLILALAAPWLPPPAAADAPGAVASIRPVHALLAGVMAGAGEPTLLVDGAQSPHDFALRPSAARRLAGAGLVVRVGPSLEAFLDRLLPTLADRARLVDLVDSPGLVLYPRRPGGDIADSDPHIWLDPENAIVIVDRLAGELAALDPANAGLYRENALAMTARIRVLDDELAARLAPLAGLPWVAFHDAWRYFGTRYGLAPPGILVADPSVPPGAARLARIRARIEDEAIRCVFVEPAVADNRLAAALVRGTVARVAVLDPLGIDLAPGPDLWFGLMRGLADGLVDCLAPD